MKKAWKVFACFLGMLLLTSCQEKSKVPDTGKYIYYLNITGTNLIKENYDGNTSYEQAAVDEMLEVLQEPEDSEECQTPFPKGLRVTSRIEENRVALEFGDSYHKMDEVQKLLLRASLVQSLVQIERIDRVGFFINDQPLTDEEGNEYGWMGAEDFVQNTGSAINSYQKATLTLYFANDKGDKLIKESRTIRFNSNTAMEKAIVEQLMKGPSESGHYPTIAAEAKLLGVSVKDNICYVNFDAGVQQNTYNLSPEIPVYSVVNSLIENGVAHRVQISVSGDTAVKFQGGLSLEKPFAVKDDLVE